MLKMKMNVLYCSGHFITCASDVGEVVFWFCLSVVCQQK